MSRNLGIPILHHDPQHDTEFETAALFARIFMRGTLPKMVNVGAFFLFVSGLARCAWLLTTDSERCVCVLNVSHYGELRSTAVQPSTMVYLSDEVNLRKNVYCSIWLRNNHGRAMLAFLERR